MTEAPKNAVVELSLSLSFSVICFLAQSVSVTELRAVSLRQRPLSYDNLIAPIRTALTLTGRALRVAEGGGTPLLFCSLVQTELRVTWSGRISLPNFKLLLPKTTKGKENQIQQYGWDEGYNVTLRL